MSTQNERSRETRDNFLSHVKSDIPNHKDCLVEIIMKYLTGRYHIKISARTLNEEFRYRGVKPDITRSTISDAVSSYKYRDQKHW